MARRGLDYGAALKGVVLTIDEVVHVGTSAVAAMRQLVRANPQR